MNGYLLKMLHVRRYCFPSYVKKLVMRPCHGSSGMSGGSIACTGWVILCFMSTSLYIIPNAGNYVRAVDGCTGKELNLLSALVAIVQVCLSSIV